jgi:hypothetical protein
MKKTVAEEMKSEQMKLIQLQVAVTLDEDAEATFMDLLWQTIPAGTAGEDQQQQTQFRA